MINPLIKIIELFVDEEQDAILQSISVVDKPAIEREFMYFSEEGRKLLYFQEDGDQRIVISPAMIPDKMIPRKEKDGSIYYVFFSKETIAKAAEYLMKYNKQSHSNINHQRIYSDDMYVMESWIKESDNDKSTDYGFGDLPVGTWFVKFRIMNDEAWAKIKSGELKGLSVEGDFLLGTEKYMSNKFSAVRKKYKSAYKGLTKDEADQLDEILHYVEMNIDVAGLPGYVDQGEKEEDMDALLQFAETYTDYPDAAVNNAKRALAWAEENGWGDCGMGPGKARANQLANREPISEDTIARMSAFQRHRQNSDTPYGEGCGKLMWDAWGGEAGVSWAEKKLKEIRKERVENTNIVSEAPGAGTIFAEEDLNIDVFGYPTRFFYICPGAIATFEHIKQMNPPEDVIGMARSAAVQADRVFQIEKEVQDAGVATMAQFSEAVVLVDDYKSIFEEIDKILGMEHDISYMDGHIETIKSYLPEEFSFARYPWDRCIADRLADGKSQTSAENICGWIKANYSADFAPQPASGNKGDRPLARIPKEDRGRTGSDKNEPGDSTTSRGGVEVSAEVESTLRDKIEKHNEANPQDSQKATLGMLKAVWRRGAGAYSVGTPGKSGMTRAQWAMARVNAFLNILAGNQSGYDKDYKQDNDLLPKGHPKASDKMTALEDPTAAEDFVRYYSPVQKQTISDFLKDVIQVYGI